MPLKKCSNGGKSGWKWGDQGHCYTGPDGKKTAIKQGIAIEGPDKFKKIQESGKGSNDDEIVTQDELIEIMSDPETSDEDFTCLAQVMNLDLNKQVFLNVKRLKG